MQIPVHLQFIGIDHSPAVEERVRLEARRLDKLSARLTGCRVAISRNTGNHQQGSPYTVTLDLTLPGHEVVVNNASDEDVYCAVRIAFDCAKRQLHELAPRHHTRADSTALPNSDVDPVASLHASEKQ